MECKIEGDNAKEKVMTHIYSYAIYLKLMPDKHDLTQYRKLIKRSKDTNQVPFKNLSKCKN